MPRNEATLPTVFKKIGKAIADVFANIYHNFIDGDWKTKVSYFVMGFGQISRGSYIRGCFNLAYQIIYFVFMVFHIQYHHLFFRASFPLYHCLLQLFLYLSLAITANSSYGVLLYEYCQQGITTSPK